MRAAIGLGFGALGSGIAVAGPPFRTDDPEPVGYQNFEFYTFTSGTHVEADTSGVGPAWEFNYGPTKDIQLHLVAPLAFDSPSVGANHFGYGDTELGVKFRFIEEDEKGSRPMVGIFPLVELPTGSEGKGLGAGYARLFLPVWVQKSFGSWTTYGGGGYWINKRSSTGGKNYWFFGWLLQKQVTKQLTLGGEIFHQTRDKVDGKASSGFNLGGFYDLNEHNHLLFSAGRGIQHSSESNRYSWYIGYQITGSIHLGRLPHQP
ncbi:MAG TPA: hypothetical protein VF776_04885 [Sphingomicrobium sp.]